MEKLTILPKGQFTPLRDITLNGLISSGINFIFIIASILFLFSLLFGGIKFILSQGKEEKLNEAKRQIINAIFGVILVFSSWAIVRLAGDFFGVDLGTFEIPTL